MALHSKGIKIGLGICVFLSFAGGVMVLGGAGSATKMCHDNIEDLLRDRPMISPDMRFGLEVASQYHMTRFTTVAGDPNPAYDCGVFLSLDWWIIAFQIFTIKLGLLATFFEKFHNKHLVMSVYSMNLVLVTILTSFYVKMSYIFEGGSGTSNSFGQAVKTIAAGGITILVSNFAFLFLFSTEEEEHQEKITPA